MTTSKTFLLPVVIDDTRDDDEQVPDKFRELQWSRLPAGAMPTAFVERVRRLLSPSEPDAPAKGLAPVAAANLLAASRPAPVGWRWKTGLLAMVAAVVIALGYVALKHSKPAQVAGLNSIAVLPLANESGDAKEQYFSDGISED